MDSWKSVPAATGAGSGTGAEEVESDD
jgi:hypothetical protein